MVAQTIDLPNVRKMFAPDPGMLIAEVDLSGADAQVVAWEADDAELKNSFRSGLKLHLKNAKDLFPGRCAGLTDEQIKARDYPGGVYYDCKRGVHATNYGARPRTLAVKLGWTMAEANRFQSSWFGLHPGILEWQRRTDEQLQTTRTIYNKFGYRIYYFDRPEHLLPEALAWIPQSTVALVTNKGMRQLREQCDFVQLLMQVHDSIIFQYPAALHDRKHLQQIQSALHVTVPYDDPLVIPWGLKVSDKSWGDCVECSWDG